MIIRDFNFAAFLIRNGFSYQIANCKIDVQLSKSEFFQQKKLFEESGFKHHREIVKSLIASTAQAECYSQLSD